MAARDNIGGSLKRTELELRLRAGDEPPGDLRMGRTGEEGTGSLGRRVGTSKCSKLVAV